MLLLHCFHRRREQRDRIGAMSLPPENRTAQHIEVDRPVIARFGAGQVGWPQIVQEWRGSGISPQGGKRRSEIMGYALRLRIGYPKQTDQVCPYSRQAAMTSMRSQIVISNLLTRRRG